MALPLIGGCGASVVAEQVPPPSIPLKAHSRWSGRLDGPMPRRGDEGLPLYAIAHHGRAPRISRGALVADLPDRGSATYVQQILPAPVRRIGAVFGLEPGTGDGSLTLVSWSLAEKHTGPCHIALAPDRWIAGTVERAEVSEYAGQDFVSPLATDGRPYRVDVVIDGSRVHIALPDGRNVSIQDEAIGRLSGSVPCWEFFRAEAGGSAVRLYETWAG